MTASAILSSTPLQRVTLSSLPDYLNSDYGLEGTPCLHDALSHIEGYAPSEAQKMRTLAGKIPRNLHGIIQLVILKDTQDNRILFGMAVQPDPARERLADMKKTALPEDNQQIRQIDHDLQTIKHNSRSPIIFGDDFEEILDASDNSMPSVSGNIAAQRSIRNTGRVKDLNDQYSTELQDGESVYSYKLNEALGLPMDYIEKTMLQKIAGAIADDLRGVFMVDLAAKTESPTRYRPLGLCIDAPLSFNELNQTLLKPLISKQAQTASKHQFALQHSVAIRTLSRDDMEKLAELLPSCTPTHSRT